MSYGDSDGVRSAGIAITFHNPGRAVAKAVPLTCSCARFEDRCCTERYRKALHSSSVFFSYCHPAVTWRYAPHQVLSHKLLDAEFSDPALRAFFVPFFSEMFVRYGYLSLVRRIVVADDDDEANAG